MDTLINYDNGAASVNDYAQDKCISGFGMLDGNLLADKVLRITKVIRFDLGNGLTIQDGVHRGFVAASPGAEVQAGNIRILNTGMTKSMTTLVSRRR